MRTPDNRLTPAEPLATVTSLAAHRTTPSPVTRATYTVPEVAALLGISRATTYVLLGNGEIPARRVGSRWIIARRRFDAWLDDGPLDVLPTGTEVGR